MLVRPEGRSEDPCVPQPLLLCPRRLGRGLSVGSFVDSRKPSVGSPDSVLDQGQSVTSA